MLVFTACAGPTTAPPATSASVDWPMFRGDLSRDGHPPAAILSARQAGTLKMLWSKAAGGAVDGTPVVVGSTVIAATGSGTIATFNLRSGAEGWTLGGLGEITGTPAVASGMVVVASTKGHAYGVRLADGRKLWDWPAPVEQQAIWSSPAIVGTRVLIGLASPYGDSPLEPGGVAALDLNTG
jgi:outer membrane protein assembly factor BamB